MYKKGFIIYIESEYSNVIDHIDKQFIDDALSNALAESSMTLNNWEIFENKTFNEPTGQSCINGRLQDCCIPFFSDDRKWKEQLNVLYEIYDIEDLARMIGVREGFIQAWHENYGREGEMEPSELYKKRIEIFFDKIKEMK